MNSTRKLVALLVVMLAVLALGPAPAAQARSAKPVVYPPQAHPYGHTYTEWEVMFWQWWLAIPAPENPFADDSGAYCAVHQSGPVWYLFWDHLGGTIVRSCTVPAGKAFLVTPAAA